MSATENVPGKMERRTFLGAVLAATGQLACTAADSNAGTAAQPNIVYVFADQWRAQAIGYAGDANARTPNIDRLAGQSVNFVNAVSGCPVCSPYRASLLTGQYWHKHGIFLNDVPLSNEAVTVAEVLRDAGYDTGYIGKWHLDGHGRLSFTPPERRHGFSFWRALECTHEYNNSQYYADDPEPKRWAGYDAIAQTEEAQRYIRDRSGGKQPFALFMSWGPPHNPYETAPQKYRDRIRAEDIVLRPNVPAENAEAARKDLAGYYAHMMALDDCVGQLMDTLDACGIAENTLFVFTSDHGDMLYSQGQQRKQRPWDESIRVPFLLRYPAALGTAGRKTECLLNTPDIMPTLLGLSGVAVPDTVQGRDFSRDLVQKKEADADAALIACITPFGEYLRKNGGREYRGIRTRQHTYVRDLNGPWLLYDNAADPHQQTNLCGKEECRALQEQLDKRLTQMLEDCGDKFEPGDAYIQRFGYTVDASGTVPVHP
jgi:arylsulfatase A-like enzyme